MKTIQYALYTKIINDNWGNYRDRVGLFFIFVGCAGISIIVWIFNWVCWLNQYCCCDFLHNPVNKRIAWWMSFSFLLLILACCISAFVIVNRFGFALNGAMCAFDRIYYDTLNGQLKEKGERWEGLKSTRGNLDNIEKFCILIKNKKEGGNNNNIIYEVGKNYTFTEDEPLINNEYNAVSRILNNFLNENNIVCSLY